MAPDTRPIGSILLAHMAKTEKNPSYMQKAQGNLAKTKTGDWAGAASGLMSQNPELVLGLAAALFGGLTNKDNRLGGALKYLLPAVLIPYFLRQKGMWNTDTMQNMGQTVKQFPQKAQDWIADTSRRATREAADEVLTTDPKTGEKYMQTRIHVPWFEEKGDQLINKGSEAFDRFRQTGSEAFGQVQQTGSGISEWAGGLFGGGEDTKSAPAQKKRRTTRGGSKPN